MNRREFLASSIFATFALMVGGTEKILAVTEKTVRVNIKLDGYEKTLDIPFSKIVDGSWWSGLIPDDVIYENYWCRCCGTISSKENLEKNMSKEKEIYEKSLNNDYGWSPFQNPILHADNVPE